MSRLPAQVARFIDDKYSALSDSKKAVKMAAYMKTDMPFYGVQKPYRLPVLKEMKKRFPPADQTEYEKIVKALWKLPKREAKYAAIDYARQHKQFINFESVALYEMLLREGSWWDFVDSIAIDLVGAVLLHDRRAAKPLMNQWIDDDDYWIRRAAIISQNHHKERTDSKQLFRHCLTCAHEREFFIRKGIGWALREYSYHNPAAVSRFLLDNQAKLSPLSFKEGAKQLVRSGYL